MVSSRLNQEREWALVFVGWLVQLWSASWMQVSVELDMSYKFLQANFSQIPLDGKKKKSAKITLPQKLTTIWYINIITFYLLSPIPVLSDAFLQGRGIQLP